MLINSCTGWEKFNALMNDLRESIAIKGKQLMPLIFAKYYLTENNSEEIYLTTDSDAKIVGIMYDEEGIMIMVVNDHLPTEIQEQPLQFAGFQATDLINLLEQLEN